MAPAYESLLLTNGDSRKSSPPRSRDLAVAPLPGRTLSVGPLPLCKPERVGTRGVALLRRVVALYPARN